MQAAEAASEALRQQLQAAEGQAQALQQRVQQLERAAAAADSAVQAAELKLQQHLQQQQRDQAAAATAEAAAEQQHEANGSSSSNGDGTGAAALHEEPLPDDPPGLLRELVSARSRCCALEGELRQCRESLGALLQLQRAAAEGRLAALVRQAQGLAKEAGSSSGSGKEPHHHQHHHEFWDVNSEVGVGCPARLARPSLTWPGWQMSFSCICTCRTPLAALSRGVPGSLILFAWRLMPACLAPPFSSRSPPPPPTHTYAAPLGARAAGRGAHGGPVPRQGRAAPGGQQQQGAAPRDGRMQPRHHPHAAGGAGQGRTPCPSRARPPAMRRAAARGGGEGGGAAAARMQHCGACARVCAAHGAVGRLVCIMWAYGLAWRDLGQAGSAVRRAQV